MITVYVDPGVHGSGCALFTDGYLISAEYRAKRLDWFADNCVCEKPVVYSDETQARVFGRRIRKADTIDLAIAAGRMTGNLPTKYVTPAQWKGSRKKGPMHKRMRAILTPQELEIIDSLDCAPSLRHNVYDAVCMGLIMEGRWK